VVSNWEESPYDLRRQQLTVASAVHEIVIGDEAAAALRELRLLDPDCERRVFRMSMSEVVCTDSALPSDRFAGECESSRCTEVVCTSVLRSVVFSGLEIRLWARTRYLNVVC
jgi:hypothetical protein